MKFFTPPPDRTCFLIRIHMTLLIEVVGLDGATAFVEANRVGQTVGALRLWVSTQAGLPSASWLRLKSGSRDLACDEAPLTEVDASVHALLRLPGG